MINVVINAISIKEGGSLIVLRELVASMPVIRPDWQWHVVINSIVVKGFPQKPNVHYHIFPYVESSGLATRLWYETSLSFLLLRLSADVLFSMTNYLPLRKIPIATLLLVQHAGHFSPIFSQLTESQLNYWGRLSWRLKGRWVKSSVRVANAVTVQTAALARHIANESQISCERIKIITHGTGQAIIQATPVTAPQNNERFRIGYITKYGVQKNFSVLFESLVEMVAKDIPFTLVLTLSVNELENNKIFDYAKDLGIASFIENHGESSASEIQAIYKSLHAFVFPSLCESFGFPMLEAMAYGIPLLVSDIDSNIEVAGDGALSFNSQDARLLALELERLAKDTKHHQQRAWASLRRVADFSWSQAAYQTVSLIEDVMEKNYHFSHNTK